MPKETNKQTNKQTTTTIIIIIIPARRQDLLIINKKKKRTCKIVDFAVPVDNRIKLKEREKKKKRKKRKRKKKDKYVDLARELKKTVEHAGDNYTNRNWCVWNSNKRINKVHNNAISILLSVNV